MDLLKLYYTTNLGTMVDEGLFDAYKKTKTIGYFTDKKLDLFYLFIVKNTTYQNHVKLWF